MLNKERMKFSYHKKDKNLSFIRDHQTHDNLK
jgi:hypothetical protein